MVTGLWRDIRAGEPTTIEVLAEYNRFEPEFIDN
jgi:hypothetical protein